MTVKKVAVMTIDDFSVGQQFELSRTVLEKDIDAFASLTGDISPLHMNSVFSRGRGFQGRVAHGGLLVGFLSMIIGVHFPGENCILQSLKIFFSSPVYAGDVLCIKAVVDQVSLGANVVVLKVNVTKGNGIVECLKGQLQIGFTKNV